MNPAFDDILGADAETRAGLFGTTAQRLGTTPQNAEKDFWVCWTLDALFNGIEKSPRLLFKGGTSLSKGYGLIRRFSEDIDVTVFRDDLGEDYSVEDLQSLSRKKRDAALDAIRDACETYVNGSLIARLSEVATEASSRAGLSKDAVRIRAHDTDRQTLLVHYPSATPADAYIEKSVKIESGAKSALDPNSVQSIRPYTDDDVPTLDLSVPNVTIVDPERTFWDKIVILHGLRRWFEIRGELRGSGHRISRHYYDLHTMIGTDVAKCALADPMLGADCVAHARMFFNRPDNDLASARPPTFALCPEGEMYDALRRDYGAMAGMIFGPIPEFDSIVESIAELQATVNGLKPEGGVSLK